jgi:hypothetical protein
MPSLLMQLVSTYILISNGIDASVGLLRACNPDGVLPHVEYEAPNEVRWVTPKWGQ